MMFRKPAQKPTDRVSVTEAGPCQKSVRLQVPPEEITPVRAAVLGEFQKEASLPGFRKGKAPLELVEKHYAKPVREETLRRVTQHIFERVVKEHNLKPVAPFQLSRTDYQDGGSLTLEATVEVEPEFALGAYRGIPLTRASAEVSSGDVAQALSKLQESMAQLVPVAEGAPKERQVPPLDDELAKDLGFKTLEELRTHVEAKLREQQRSAQQRALEADLCDALLQRHAFSVPPQLVSHQTERLTRDFKVRRLLAGRTETQVDEEAAKFTEQLRTNAERYVKLSFVLDRIAQRESVTVAQEEVVNHLWQVARRWQKDPTEVRKFFDAQGLWPSVVSTIRQEKTVTLLLGTAHITNGIASVREVKS
ncbi:MAG: trigger factor [Candidatus Omnitrophica bacterium]|nr:trigger factor [Candidatus Omnitrophota bacterium]